MHLDQKCEIFEKEETSSVIRYFIRDARSIMINKFRGGRNAVQGFFSYFLDDFAREANEMNHDLVCPSTSSGQDNKKNTCKKFK